MRLSILPEQKCLLRCWIIQVIPGRSLEADGGNRRKGDEVTDRTLAGEGEGLLFCRELE